MTCFILVSCQEKKKVEVSVSEGESKTYACPMKCEGEKTYAVAGKCPVCGMSLEPINGDGIEVLYDMWLTTMPEEPQAGEPVILAFTPKIEGRESEQVPLDEVHEKKLHVIVVSDDLAWYRHIHPEFQADGSYTIQETFPAGGEYIVFADYHPTGGANQVERRTVTIKGTAKKREEFKEASLTTTTDVYKVTLKPAGGKLLTNNMNHLGVVVTKNGKAVTDFENIMGAKGHLVIISGDGERYLHVHPEEVDGKLDMHARFDKPGIYRAFFQFQTNGTLHTSYFTLNVEEGKEGELETSHGHDHDHDHDHHEEDHQHN